MIFVPWLTWLIIFESIPAVSGNEGFWFKYGYKYGFISTEYESEEATETNCKGMEGNVIKPGPMAVYTCELKEQCPSNGVILDSTCYWVTENNTTRNKSEEICKSYNDGKLATDIDSIKNETNLEYILWVGGDEHSCYDFTSQNETCDLYKEYQALCSSPTDGKGIVWQRIGGFSYYISSFTQPLRQAVQLCHAMGAELPGRKWGNDKLDLDVKRHYWIKMGTYDNWFLVFPWNRWRRRKSGKDSDSKLFICKKKDNGHYITEKNPPTGIGSSTTTTTTSQGTGLKMECKANEREWEYTERTKYYISTENGTYDEAVECCENNEGTLLSYTSLNEKVKNEFLSESEHYWIESDDDNELYYLMYKKSNSDWRKTKANSESDRRPFICEKTSDIWYTSLTLKPEFETFPLGKPFRFTCSLEVKFADTYDQSSAKQVDLVFLKKEPNRIPSQQKKLTESKNSSFELELTTSITLYKKDDDAEWRCKALMDNVTFYSKKINLDPSYSVEEVATMSKERSERLKVDQSTMSVNIRKRISAYDERPAAKAIGSVAIAYLIMIAIGIVAMDMPRVIRFFRKDNMVHPERKKRRKKKASVAKDEFDREFRRYSI